MSSALAKRIKYRRYLKDSNETAAEDEILAIGYSCTLFRDDEKAEFLDEERHMIVHPSDESVTTDRFDGRLCIQELHLYDSANVPPNSADDYNKEEGVDETDLELERYRDLIAASDDEFEEEQSNNGDSAAPRGGGAEFAPPPPGSDYHPSNSAANGDDGKEEKEQLEGKTKKEKLFVPPAELELPSELRVPETTQIHAIIAKTATFVANSGPQMEIVIKAKQKSNDGAGHFEFLEFDHALRPYYDHVLAMIKTGRYRFIEEQEESDEDDSDDGDGNYLHPSLMISSNNKKSSTTTGNEEKSLEPATREPESFTTNYIEEEQQQPANVDLQPSIDLQPIIDRLAEYVARNGDIFEQVVRGRRDPLYEFIENGHAYNEYYRRRVEYYRNILLATSESSIITDQQSLHHRSQSSSPLPSTSTSSTITTSSGRIIKDTSKSIKSSRESKSSSSNHHHRNISISKSSSSKHRKRNRNHSSDDDDEHYRRKSSKSSRKISKIDRHDRQKSAPPNRSDQDDYSSTSDEDGNTNKNRRLPKSISYPAFVPLPECEDEKSSKRLIKEEEKGNEEDEKKSTTIEISSQTVSPPMSDKSVKSSGEDEEEGKKKKTEEEDGELVAKKLQEERRAKAKIFLRLIKDRDQKKNCKLVQPTDTKTWENE